MRPPWADQLADGAKSLSAGFARDFLTQEFTRLAVSFPTEARDLLQQVEM